MDRKVLEEAVQACYDMLRHRAKVHRSVGKFERLASPLKMELNLEWLELVREHRWAEAADVALVAFQLLPSGKNSTAHELWSDRRDTAMAAYAKQKEEAGG